MTTTTDAAPRRYNAIVFKQAPPTEDFTCSTEIVLPGQHTEPEAWRAVFAELRGLRGAQYAGGDVRPC